MRFVCESIFDLVNVVVETASRRVAFNVHKTGGMHRARLVADATRIQALVQIVGIVNGQHGDVRIELLNLNGTEAIVVYIYFRNTCTTGIVKPKQTLPCICCSTPAAANLCTT